MSEATDDKIINFAMGLLRAGTRSSAIATRLEAEFSLTPKHARELAGQAIKDWRNRTKPLKSGDRQ
jgi:hypothetical protein